MSKLKILTYPDNVLRRPTRELDTIDGDVQKMIDHMSATMYAAPGVGLAAIQVGWDRSVLIYDISPSDDGGALQVLINPRIIDQEGERVSVFEISVQREQRHHALENVRGMRGCDFIGLA